jgi:hypothetical protein
MFCVANYETDTTADVAMVSSSSAASSVAVAESDFITSANESTSSSTTLAITNTTAPVSSSDSGNAGNSNFVEITWGQIYEFTLGCVMTLLQCNVCKNNAPKFLTF